MFNLKPQVFVFFNVSFLYIGMVDYLVDSSVFLEQVVS